MIPVSFLWWDDALRVAQNRASLTGVRQRVGRGRHGFWEVKSL